MTAIGKLHRFDNVNGPIAVYLNIDTTDHGKVDSFYKTGYGIIVSEDCNYFEVLTGKGVGFIIKRDCVVTECHIENADEGDDTFPQTAMEP